MKSKTTLTILLVAVTAILFSCKKEGDSLEERLKSHVAYLTSEECLGREPFTEKADNSVRYIAQMMQKIGLVPYIDENGENYLQQVGLVKIAVNAPEEISVKGTTEEWAVTLKRDEDYSLVTQDTVSVDFKDCELFFAGYGIVAPEYSKNDYEGLEHPENKIALVLINDPGLDNGDSSYFRGNEMTYYGRWTYKMEEGARQGLAGVIIIHNDRGAGYGWNVAKAGNKIKFALDDPTAEKTIPIQGWITDMMGRELLKQCGLDANMLFEEAKKPGFKPVAMNCKTSIRIETEYETKQSPNVIGYIAGTGNTDESVIVSAHWDHIGTSPGATDNATGIAWLLEVARTLKAKGITPKRNIVFFAPTCEEKGMYGSKYHANHPAFPLEKAAAIVNMDVLPLWGKSSSLTITGWGHYPEMDEFVTEIAAKHGRKTLPDQESYNGMFYRSDQLPFMQKGVTPLFAKGWEEKDGRIENYWKNVYHTPNDHMNETDDYSGLVQEVELFADIIWELANRKLK